MQVTVGTGIITRKKENCCKIAKVCVFFFFVVENGISSVVTVTTEQRSKRAPGVSPK